MKCSLVITGTILVSGMMLTGCGKPKQTPAAGHHAELPTTPDPVQQRLQHLTGSIKAGMTEDEVTQAAGEPKSVRTMVGTKTPVVWQYELGDGKWFVVRFDVHNRVTLTEGGTSTRVQ